MVKHFQRPLSGGSWEETTLINFNESKTKEEQLELLRDTKNWRFVPGFQEFEEMLKSAGFKDIKTEMSPHPRAETDSNKKNILKFAFSAHK